MRYRTIAEILDARKTPGGCCSRYADNMGCDCEVELAKEVRDRLEAIPKTKEPSTMDHDWKIGNGNATDHCWVCQRCDKVLWMRQEQGKPHGGTCPKAKEPSPLAQAIRDWALAQEAEQAVHEQHSKASAAEWKARGNVHSLLPFMMTMTEKRLVLDGNLYSLTVMADETLRITKTPVEILE